MSTLYLYNNSTQGFATNLNNLYMQKAGVLVYYFSNNSNIYTSFKDACDTTVSPTQNDSKAIYMIKSGTHANISKIGKYNGSYYVGIYIGKHIVYVRFCDYDESGNLSNFNGQLGYYESQKGSSGGGPLNCTAAAGLTKIDSSSSPSLSKNGTSINSSQIVEGSDGDASITDAEFNSFGTSSTASSSSSSTSASVTYPGVLEYSSAYPTNYSSHTETAAIAAYNETVSSAESSGIDYSQLRYIFGSPYQFLPTTDFRVTSEGFMDSSKDLGYAGYEFADKILSRMPLLYLTPGNSVFLGGNADDDTITSILTSVATGDNASLNEMLSDYTGKLYGINPAYAEYYTYVNPMCRAGAINLQLNDEELYGTSPVDYNWSMNEGQAYEFYVEEDTTDDEDTSEDTETEEDEEEEDTGTFYSWISAAANTINYMQSYIYYKNCIPFYINSDVSFSDSFSNETTESSLASTINGLSDQARELQFLMGTASSAIGEAWDKIGLETSISSIKESISNIVDGIADGNSIFSTIASSVKTIVSGGRLLFPQIWSGSSFSKSYSITIKLTTPSNDLFSWWLNIYVPLCHLLGFVCPRSEYTNSYNSPFIVKAFYKGMFNIDMGIITEMTFNKGKEIGWTKDCLPTVVEVSMTINDLYSAMGITSEGKMFKGFTFQNVEELDYLANLCGININEPDTFRMIDYWYEFNLEDKFTDYIPNLKNTISNAIGNKFLSLYNNFWF